MEAWHPGPDDANLVPVRGVSSVQALAPLTGGACYKLDPMMDPVTLVFSFKH